MRQGECLPRFLELKNVDNSIFFLSLTRLKKAHLGAYKKILKFFNFEFLKLKEAFCKFSKKNIYFKVSVIF